MKFTGENVLHAPVEQVWDALLDPGVLVRTIPGCSRLEATGENAYDMTVTAGVAAIKGTYAGTCRLHDLQPHESLRMDVEGSGGPGTIAAEVAVSFADAGDGTTRVTYDADATVGGMIGGVGQRMLSSVSRRMAGEFFGNVDRAIAEPAPVDQASVERSPDRQPVGQQPVGQQPVGQQPVERSRDQQPSVGQVFTAPAAPAGGSDDFLRGIAVGAGLVLAGVLAGGLLGRRR